MRTPAQQQNLDIHPSVTEAALLQKAAALRGMEVSDFVLKISLIIARQTVESESTSESSQLLVSKEAYDWLVRELDRPAEDIPALQKLFAEKTVLDS
jgi:uncharacterized protein (DUF1778 family)